MRFNLTISILLTVFILWAPPVQAQNAPANKAPADQTNSAIPDEYNNVPSGLLLPDESNAQQNEDTAISSPVEDVADDAEAMTMEDVMAAFQKGQFSHIVRRVTLLAESNHHQAQEILGIMYHNGQGVPKDLEKSFSWLARAADANQPLAQHYLGVAYFAGEGVLPDPAKAFMWLSIAAVHYPDGPEKDRALADRANIYNQLSRRDKDRAQEMTREWLGKKGEERLLLPQ